MGLLVNDTKPRNTVLKLIPFNSGQLQISVRLQNSGQLQNNILHGAMSLQSIV